MYEHLGLQDISFIMLYGEATEGNRSIAALRLAVRSGYKSYSTFSDAFKRITGLSVTDWMKRESVS